MRHPITRREAVHRLAAAGAALALPPAARAQPRRPNVVFILIDDLRWDAFSHLGHPFMRTPNIDRLAAEGARFENAFVVISLCSPSRACFLTGCHPQRTGVFGNEAEELDPRVPTFPQLLQRAGYETGYVGKWHMVPTADPRPGFDYWLSFAGQGVYENPSLNENGRQFRQEGYLTDLLTDYAVSYLRREHSRPFCLCLAHKAVHGPFTPAERHRGALAEAALPKPPSFDEDFADKPAWLRAQMVRGIGREAWEKNRSLPPPDRLPPANWDPQRGRDYYRMLLAVDDSVGAVLKALEETGRLDDTVVVFTSDNGYFQGEFRRGDKRLAYEPSIRIPLLVRYPPLASAGAVIRPMALNVDLCPTFLDLCGAPAPEQVAGCSLRAVLQQPAAPPDGWRRDFLYQYFQEGAYPGIPDLQAVRNERWKYIRAPRIEGSDELYDLLEDPHELNNLAGEAGHAETRKAMAARLGELVAEAAASALPPPPPPPARILLRYVFDQPGDQVVDLSGDGRTATAAGVAQSTVDGRPARRLEGAQPIIVEPRLSPPIQGGPFRVRVILRPEQPDGVVLSQGGESNGYSLELDAGKASFLLRSAGRLYRLEGPAVSLHRWQTWTARLRADGRLSLTVDGQELISPDRAQPVKRLPSEGLTIGADAGTRVGEGAGRPFVGALAELEIASGQ